MPAPVRRRQDFDALSRSRAHGRSGPLRVVRAELGDDDDPTTARVAFAVPRTVGGAVVRNRIRRRLRPMMDELHRTGQLAPGLYLIGVRPGAHELSAADLRRHLAAATSRVHARAERG